MSGASATPRPWPVAPLTGLALGAGTVALGWKAIVLVAGASLAFWMAVSPAWCLYVLVITMPVVLDFGGGVTLTRIVAPLAACLVLANAALGRAPRPALLRWPDGVLLSAYFGLAVVSVGYAANRDDAVQALGPLALYLTLAFTTQCFVRDRAMLVRIAWLLAGTAIVESLITVAQVNFRFVLPGEWRPTAMANIDISASGFRADGTTTHPILLAGFLQMALPFIVLLLLQTRRLPARLLLLASLPLVLYAWTSTYARSAAIAMAAMLVFTLAISSRAGRWVAAGGVGLALAVLAVHGMSIEAVLHGIEDIELFGAAFQYADLFGSVESFRFRVESWAGGLNTFLALPLTGAGLGQSESAYLRYLPPWATSPVHPAEIHNVFLETAAELGVVGFAAFTGLWVYAFVCLARAWSDPSLGGFARTLAVVLVGQAVLLSFTPMVRDIWLTLMLAIAVGRISAQRLERSGAQG